MNLTRADPAPALAASAPADPGRARLRLLPFAALAAVAVASPVALRAQEIEPRAYSNAPVGVNFFIGGYAYTRGGIATGDTLPITNPHLHTSNAVVAFAHVLDLWGMSAKFDAVVPYTWLSGSADYQGAQVQRIVNGFADPAFRLSVNLYGAPALSLPEFASYRQDLIIGASLRVFAPWGQYDASRLINIGTNRWAFKPEIGISKAIDAWTFEFTAAATLYAENNDFYGATRCRGIRFIRSRVMRSTALPTVFGDRSTRPISPADARRSTARSATTCSRTGASAARWRSPSIARTR